MMKMKPLYSVKMSATTVLLLLMLVVGGASKGYIGGSTRFAYRTEIGSTRVEVTTTVISPLDDEQYSVVTTTEESTSSAGIRLCFFGGAAQSLGLYRSEDANSVIFFDLSPLGALASEPLEPSKKYLLPDGGKLQTGERVIVAGLSGVEGTYTREDMPGATIEITLADDPYIRQFLPFPLRVHLEYEEEANTGSEEEGHFVHSFSGRIELIEYTHSVAEGKMP